MSIFERMDRTVSRSVDALYSVRFICRPMISTPNGRSSADTTRQDWMGKGVLDFLPVNTPVEIGNRNRTGHDLMTPVAGERIEMSVDCLRYPAAKTAKQGDRLETDDLRNFTIIALKPDGISRVIFEMISS